MCGPLGKRRTALIAFSLVGSLFWNLPILAMPEGNPLPFPNPIGERSDQPPDWERLAERAEAIVKRGFELVWSWKVEAGIADSLRDTLKSGMIGVEWSPLTTTLGNEGAKGLSIQPGWAKFLVREMMEKGVREGDWVALSMTGSFPGLNLAALAACEVLGVSVVAITSLGSSSFGANQPGFTWPEIEHRLRQAGLLHIGTTILTLGGTGDRGAEWDRETQALAEECASRTPFPLLKPRNLKQAIRMRLLHYGDLRRYRCFINIGGNQATLGGGARPRFSQGGWYTEPPPGKSNPPGVMDYFLKANVPCLNLLHLEELNRRLNIVPAPIR